MNAVVVLIPTDDKNLTDALMDAVGFTYESNTDTSPFFGVNLLRDLRNAAVVVGRVAGRRMSDETFNYILRLFKDKVNGIISDKVRAAGITATINIDELIREVAVLKINLTISDIDYNSVVAAALPMLDNYANKPGFLGEVLNVIGEDRERLAEALMNSLSDYKKEKLVCLLATEYNAVICAILNKALAEKGISLGVSDLSVSEGTSHCWY